METKPVPLRTQTSGLNFLNNWKNKKQEQSNNNAANSIASSFTSPNLFSQNSRDTNRCSPAVNNLLSSLSPVLNLRNNNSNNSENKFSRVSFNVDLDEENDDSDRNIKFSKNASPLPNRNDFEKAIQSPSRDKRSTLFSPKISLEPSNNISEFSSRPTFPLPNITEINPNTKDIEPFSPSTSIPENSLFLEENNHDSGMNDLSQSSKGSLLKYTDENSDSNKNTSKSNDLQEKKILDEEKLNCGECYNIFELIK